MGLIFYDIPELEGSNTEIALANLCDLEREFESLVEKRLAHLSELADAILRDGGDVDVIKSIMLSIRSEGNADSESIIDDNRQSANVIFAEMSLVERLIVFKETVSRMSSEQKDIFRQYWQEQEVTVSADASERIAYLKNSYNDTAYLQFSSLLSSPRAAYFSSVVDVCESVYNGSCEYCILPVETDSDGKLLSFYEMILKYGFRITAVYDLQSGGGYTRYALLSRRFAINSTGLRSKARNRYFEFIITDNDNVSLEELLSAARFCSLKLCRIDTLSVRSGRNGSGSLLCPVFKCNGSDMQTFLAFLAIDCPDFIPVGLYMQI